MASYTQFGYSGYPTASQLLSSNSAHSNQSIVDPVTDEVSISVPSTAARTVTLECVQNTRSSDIPSGGLSPDTMSQNTNASVPGISASISTLADSNADDSTSTVTLTHLSVSGNPCCENGRPIITDPVSGQTVCSCQYDSARLALSSYSRLPASSVGVYGTPYPSTDQNPYQSIGVESSAFYSPLSNPYALKESTAGGDMTAWTSASLQPTTGYYSYDPMSAYGYGANYDLAARRKNATRESTATLKAWLNEHKKNPYPTKGEKIMLAIITKMTLTQVSTWFANARRRLKKENKMTWEPKNRTDDDDDAIVSDDEKDKDDRNGTGNKIILPEESAEVNEIDKTVDEDRKPIGSEQDLHNTSVGFGRSIYHHGNSISHAYHPYPVHSHAHSTQHLQSMLPASYHHAPSNNSSSSNEKLDITAVVNNNSNNKNSISNSNVSVSKNLNSRDCGVPVPASKPKIWSLADTVACKTPPPLACLGQQHQHQIQQQLHQKPHFMRTQLTSQHTLEQEPQHHIMSNFGGTSFTRTLTTVYENFQGAATAALQHPHSTNNLLFNINNNNQHTTNNLNTATSIMPLAISPNIQNQQHQHHSHHHFHSHTQQQQQQQATATAQHVHLFQQEVNPRGVGFLEVQPDTPPQTPPNLKLPNALQPVSLQSVRPTSLLNVPLTNPLIPLCRNSNNNITDLNGVSSSMSTTSSLYSVIDSNSINFSARFASEYSPRDDSSISSSTSGRSSVSGSSSNSPRLNPHASESNSFKTLVKG